MKKKIFLGAGAAILVAAAAFAGKARITVAGVYYTTGATCHALDNSSGGFALVTAAPNAGATTAKVITKAGGQLKLYITSTCKNVTYLVP